MIADVSDFIAVSERVGVIRCFSVDVGDVAENAKVSKLSVLPSPSSGYDI